jgi:hypothetical protein
VVADIREVTFLDSQTPGVFASAIEQAATQASTDPGERFALVVDVEQSHTRRVLDLARPIIGDVPTYPSRDAALEALRNRYTEPARSGPSTPQRRFGGGEQGHTVRDGNNSA